MGRIAWWAPSGTTPCFESHTTPNPGVCINAFFLTPGPWPSYSAIGRAGLSSRCLSFIIKALLSANEIDNFHNTALSKKKKKLVVKKINVICVVFTYTKQG